MIKMLFDSYYVSCNCNQTPSSAHWGKNNLICYASCNSVVIYNPKVGSGGKVISTLVSHTKRVNSVRWLSGLHSETELVSGSTDNDAIVWSLRDDTYVPFVLKGHQSNVNIVDGLYKGPDMDNAVVVTVSMDSTVKIWRRNSYETDDFILSQNISNGNSICVGVRISFHLSSVILAVALDTSEIELHVEKNHSFSLSNKLKGHEDWVPGLDFTLDYNGDLLLASCSQDMYVRIWRITPRGLGGDTKFVIETEDGEYLINIDSILSGHEGWIYSVNWNQKTGQLLSASLDKSLVVWEFDSESNLWVDKFRLGEVGGNTLGFYGAMFSPDGSYILAHSYHGAFHIWSGFNDWKPVVTLGGHFDEVTDLQWEPRGEFIVTVSADQTTRIHAPWSIYGKEPTWHEIARPQVHGYDLSSIAMISRYKFASSAEEKVIRVFEGPRNFVENFSRICNINDNFTEEGNSGPKGASVPSLGLSNKAVFAENNLNGGDKNGFYPEESHFVAAILNEPPTEETLLQNTLWPETQKLYGHGYEVYSLAASPDGKLLASACKATTTEHAAVLLWDTTTWNQIGKLLSHTLTVAQMSFSPNSEHLLTVSRDRRWSLFSKGSNGFELVATTDKNTSIHTRIIWCCAWSHDSQYFATGSRDGKVVVWNKIPTKSHSVLGQYEAVNYLELKSESITGVAFAPGFVQSSYLVAVGFESGAILVYKWDAVGWNLVCNLEKNVAHHLAVKKLMFRPIFGKAGCSYSEHILQLASCSSDHSVRIFDLNIS